MNTKSFLSLVIGILILAGSVNAQDFDVDDNPIEPLSYKNLASRMPDGKKDKVVFLLTKNRESLIVQSELSRDWKEINEIKQFYDITIIDFSEEKHPDPPTYKIGKSGSWQRFHRGTFSASKAFTDTIHYELLSNLYYKRSEDSYRRYILIWENVVAREKQTFKWVDGERLDYYFITYGVWVTSNRIAPPPYDHLMSEYKRYIKTLADEELETSEQSGCETIAVAAKPEK